MKKLNVRVVSNFIKNLKRVNKKVWLVCGSSLAVIAVLIVSISLITGGSNQKKLVNSMEELAKDFYENFYYEQAASSDKERQEFVSAYSETGIKIDLENLARYAGSKKGSTKTSEEVLKEFVNSKTDKSCDIKESKAIIYPTGKYEKEDYKLEVVLECEFNK